MDLVVPSNGRKVKHWSSSGTFPHPKGALKTIVASLIPRVERCLSGVEDRTRGVKGVPDVLREKERLANLFADNISPKLVPFHRGSRLAENACSRSRDLPEP